MLEKYKKIENPLTIIAIFCGISELSMAATVIFGTPALAAIFIWFVVLFPPFLVLAFFLTLNFNHKVLYAPKDFRTDQAFIEATRRELVQNIDILREGATDIKEIAESAPADPAANDKLQTAIKSFISDLDLIKQRVNDPNHEKYLAPYERRILRLLNQQPSTFNQILDSIPNGDRHEMHESIIRLERRGLVTVDAFSAIRRQSVTLNQVVTS